MEGKASVGLKDADVQRETQLQAVIFAEFGTDPFLPITFEKPKHFPPVACANDRIRDGSLSQL